MAFGVGAVGGKIGGQLSVDVRKDFQKAINLAVNLFDDPEHILVHALARREINRVHPFLATFCRE